MNEAKRHSLPLHQKFGISSAFAVAFIRESDPQECVQIISLPHSCIIREGKTIFLVVLGNKSYIEK
jgi:hypothetical protein